MNLPDDLKGELAITIGGRSLALCYKAKHLRALEKLRGKTVLAVVDEMRRNPAAISIDFICDAVLCGLLHLKDPTIDAEWVDDNLDTTKLAEIARAVASAIVLALRGPDDLAKIKARGDSREPTPPAEGDGARPSLGVAG